MRVCHSNRSGTAPITSWQRCCSASRWVSWCSPYAAGLAGARLPDGLGLADLLVVGLAAAIGFTVALFFATAAFPPGPLLAETKMGALLSFGAAPLALLAPRLLRPVQMTGITAPPGGSASPSNHQNAT
jgi:hypothetical protein